ncbi:hypothetical protein D9758_007358 [Tetrapyrgos nigripes]|uniref:Major facilitator superfamily (MFS) profile domain-containing protein n=1 Tax=Tetrapyrgos nigripes TaxID=182062 RepID=A0A8H5GB03_9AGAR|nr:hypothetical protein D9758_007358 [Tetrapyrgos nigripes]
MGWNTHASNTDPPEVRKWRIHLIALVASMSTLAMGYDTAVIGGTMALDSFIKLFWPGSGFPDKQRHDTRQYCFDFSVRPFAQAGCFFGALLTFPIAEIFGRKRTVMLAALVFLVGGTLMTASRGNLNMVYGGRPIAGLGIGASSLTVPVYLAEGEGMLGFWINYGTDRGINVDSQSQWIIPLAIQPVPGVSLFLVMMWCPESPRWLARGNNFDAAERILVRIRALPANHPYIQQEMNEIRAQVEQRSTNRLSKKQMFMKLFQKGTRNRLGLGLAMMFYSRSQVNVITYYAPRIFETLGISGTSVKLFSTGFYGITKTRVGMLAFSFIVVERVGRRKGLIWGAFLGCIPMWYIGGYVMRADPATAAARGSIHRDGWGYLAMASVYVNGFIVCATWQGITWTYASEIFPLDIRMLCVALTTAMTWLGSFIIARSTPYMISDFGYGAYFFFGTVLVCMGLWSFFFVPETKGKTLEEMDALFMKPMHKVVWAQIRGRPVLDDHSGSKEDRRSSVAEEEKVGIEHLEIPETNNNDKR